MYTINMALDELDLPNAGEHGNIRFLNGNLVPLDQLANGERPTRGSVPNDTEVPTEDDTTTARGIDFEIVAEAQAQVIAAGIEQAYRKEANAITRAIKKHGDDHTAIRLWWAEWSEKHAQHVRDSVAPSIHALGRMLGS